MPDKLGSEHWRTRAQEARALAEGMTDPDAQRMMMRIANDYEKIADRAEQLARNQSQ